MSCALARTGQAGRHPEPAYCTPKKQGRLAFLQIKQFSDLRSNGSMPGGAFFAGDDVRG